MTSSCLPLGPPSFPTRRSSDLHLDRKGTLAHVDQVIERIRTAGRRPGSSRDRKSTRLNSSHRCISYAGFCLRKTNHNRKRHYNAHTSTVNNRNYRDAATLTVSV